MLTASSVDWNGKDKVSPRMEGGKSGGTRSCLARWWTLLRMRLICCSLASVELKLTVPSSYSFVNLANHALINQSAVLNGHTTFGIRALPPVAAPSCRTSCPSPGFP